MDIYIDADACPVKEDVFRIAKRYNLKVFTVSNRSIHLPKAEWIIPVVVENRFDAVDDWLVKNIQSHDILVTNDLLLADRAIKKSVFVIDPRGKILNGDNIGEALANRELMAHLRSTGALDTGPKAMGKKHKSNFCSQLDELVHRARKTTT